MKKSTRESYYWPCRSVFARLAACSVNPGRYEAQGPGLLESAYQGYLAYELRTRGFRLEVEKSLPVVSNNLYTSAILCALCGKYPKRLIEDTASASSARPIAEIVTAPQHLKLEPSRTDTLLHKAARGITDPLLAHMLQSPCLAQFYLPQLEAVRQLTLKPQT